MTASERATAGAVRSAHVAHFLPPDQGRVARLAAPALERSARDASAPQLLIIVPDAAAAVSLARALATLPAAEGRRIIAATSGARAKRLLAAGPAQVVIGSMGAIAPAVIATVLKLDAVTTLVFAGADELDVEDPDLATIMAEIPKGASRLLTALEANEAVEALIERYMHKARRVTEDATAAEGATSVGTTNVRFLTVTGPATEALPQILDEVDAPTATIVASDPATAEAATAMVRAIGNTDGALAKVTDGAVEAHTALVVVLGVPTAAVWAQVLAAKPAQLVAVITPRQRTALQRLAGDAVLAPFAARAAVLKARAAEARARAELRDALAAGIPTREVLALEPLLAEFDGLEIAAAALRLLEQTRQKQEELVKAAEIRVRTVMKEAMAAQAESGEGGDRGDRGDRPRDFAPRSGGPRSFAPRGDKPYAPRGDKPRSFAPRGDKPYAPRGDKPYAARGDKPRGPRRDDDFPLSEPGERPRSYAPRGDKPAFGGRSGGKPGGFAPRGGGDKPRGFAPRGDKPGFAPRGDKPRGPRRDDDRGPRGPRSPR